MQKITIFTSNTCPHCHTAKDYLQENGYSYEEKNVSEDASAKKELIGMGYMGVPVILIDDNVVEGFNREKLDQLLG